MNAHEDQPTLSPRHAIGPAATTVSATVGGMPVEMPAGWASPPASRVPGSVMELRPATVLSLGLAVPGDDPKTRAKAWQILRGACSTATRNLGVALIARAEEEGADIVFGLHRANKDNALLAVHVARTAAAELARKAGGAQVRAGLASGYLMASLHRRGGWTGEVIAGRTVSFARTLAAMAAPERMDVDSTTRRLMVFARSAEIGDGAPIDDAPQALPLLGGEDLMPPTLPSARPMVGRKAERQALGACIDRLHAGQGGVVWVGGEAGMGKTTLCLGAAAERLGTGALWLHHGCGTPDSDLLAVLARTVGLSPGATAETTADGVLAAAKRRPIMLMVDDLHLADDPTLALVRRLAAGTAQAPLLLVTAGLGARPTVLDEVPLAGDIRLAHLSDEETDALIVAAGQGRLPPATVAAIAYCANRVPLFAAELAHEAALAPAGDGAVSLPITLVSQILCRLDKLPLDRALLAAAAHLAPCTVAELAAAWPGERESFDHELDGAVHSGILSLSAGPPETAEAWVTHPLIGHILRFVTRPAPQPAAGAAPEPVATALPQAGTAMDTAAIQPPPPPEPPVQPPAPATAAAAAAAEPAKPVRASRESRLLTEPIVFDEVLLPGFVRIALATAASLLVIFIAWASLIHLDEIASASGQVVPSGAVQVVQHLEGGVVREILVAEGDLVHEGQILVRLNPTQAQAEYQQLKARMMGLLLHSERLKAVIEKRDPDFGESGAGYPDLVANQREIWASQLAAQATAREVIDRQIDQKTKEVAQYQAMLGTARRQLAITRDQAAIREEGVKAGVVSRQVYLETRRAEVSAEGEVARLQDQISVNSDTLAEVRKRSQNLTQTQLQDALTELGTVSTEMAQVKNGLAKLEDRVNRIELKAPVTGLVQELKVRTVGEVVPAGGLLMRVVPVNDVLEAEVRISTADIGHVQVGLPAKLKVATYEYVRYGMLDGTLSKISATTFPDEQGKPFYKGTVALAASYLGPGVGQNPIQPGMSVEANIVMGNKRLIEYLLKPIFVPLKSSFHER